MRPYHRAYDVMRVFGMVDPIAYGFVGSVFQGLAAARRRPHFCPQHTHAGYIGRLALDVHFTHIDDALHAHQGTNRGGGHAVLSGTGFSNDARLVEPTG